MMFRPAANKYNELCNSLSEEERERFKEMVSIFFDFLIESKITVARGSNKIYEVHVDVLETDE